MLRNGQPAEGDVWQDLSLRLQSTLALQEEISLSATKNRCSSESFRVVRGKMKYNEP